MSAARARPGDGRDSNKESNAAKVRDGPGLQGTNGRVGDPQATAGAQAKWDDKKAAYVAAHGTTHHAAHRDRQGLPALFGSTVEKNFQGKTGQRGSAANFLPAQECQHKKRLLSPMASVGGSVIIKSRPFQLSPKGKVQLCSPSLQTKIVRIKPPVGKRLPFGSRKRPLTSSLRPSWHGRLRHLPVLRAGKIQGIRIC
jgi:hypothetical protein